MLPLYCHHLPFTTCHFPWSVPQPFAVHVPFLEHAVLQLAVGIAVAVVGVGVSVGTERWCTGCPEVWLAAVVSPFMQ